LTNTLCFWAGGRYREGVSTQPSTQPDTSALDRFATAIDRDGEIPIGVQLGWALRNSIRDGWFAPGERLPGLRDLAEATGVNVNTVRAVYQRLEREGLIDSRQGSGTFVTPEPAQSSAVALIAADAAREAHATGADPREVAAALYVALPQATSGTATGSGDGGMGEKTSAEEFVVEHRRTLRAQIATLERAISEIEAEHPGVAPRPTATRSGPGPTLLSAEELEGVRSELVRRLAQVQSAIDQRAAGEAVGQKSASAADTTPDPSKRPARPRSTARPAAAGT
jgi:GntR family transcriptional regulator